MRKIFVSEMITIDGYFADIDSKIDWHNVDLEFNKYASEMLQNFGTLIFGKTTYELMFDYWPSAKASDQYDAIVAKKMNSLDKIVFSKSITSSSWHGTKVVSEIDPEEIKKWKEAPGKNIVIFGSGTIVQQFANLGLIDEYLLVVNPVILGKGKPLFKDLNKINLQLLNSREFKSGNVLLHYKS